MTDTILSPTRFQTLDNWKCRVLYLFLCKKILLFTTDDNLFVRWSYITKETNRLSVEPEICGVTPNFTKFYLIMIAGTEGFHTRLHVSAIGGDAPKYLFRIFESCIRHVGKYTILRVNTYTRSHVKDMGEGRNHRKCYSATPRTASVIIHSNSNIIFL